MNIKGSSVSIGFGNVLDPDPDRIRKVGFVPSLVRRPKLSGSFTIVIQSRSSEITQISYRQREDASLNRTDIKLGTYTYV